MMAVTPRRWKPLLSFVTCALAAVAQADGVTVTLQGSHIVSVQSGPHVVLAKALDNASSVGQVSAFETHQFSCRAADDLDLASYFGRENLGSAPWIARFGKPWHDENGPAPDFFVFEIGGNDFIEAAPIFPDQSVGQNAVLSGWTNTGYTAQVGINKGQQAFGLCFRVTDLKDGAGAFLSPQSTLIGIQITSSSIDGAVFALARPDLTLHGELRQLPVPEVRGHKRMWTTTEVWFQGPRTSQFASAPNPFLDYRLSVQFVGPNGESYEVPGFYDGDGYGSPEGRVWKARLTPPSAGLWTARASFRAGPGVALSFDPLAGAPVAFDGQSVHFVVDPPEAHASNFRKWGALEYVGKPYLKFRDGPYFLKGGTNSPENLLGAYCFTNVQDGGNIGRLHAFAPHQADWINGDPNFASDTSAFDAKGLIGALNYLSTKGVNSIYFLPLNLGGDGQDVSPFVGYGATPFERTHYNLRRLDQWNKVFHHAQNLGMLLHFVLSETESGNEQWLDGGALGPERMLFQRELVARFAHHLAIKWNMGEEWDRPLSLLHQMADHLRQLDAYDHPLAVHVYPGDMNTYNQIAGDSRYRMTSMQYDSNQAGWLTEQLRTLGAASGSNWVVDMDENGSAGEGVSPWNQDTMRKSVLYDVYFSGGNIEWYLGYHALPTGGDVDIEDFRTREAIWEATTRARTFMENNLPFWEMLPADHLVSGEAQSFGGAEVFIKPGTVYAVDLPAASPSGALNLGGAGGTFTQRWFNPRNGQVEGGSTVVAGNQTVNIGTPPSSSGEDWVTWFVLN